MFVLFMLSDLSRESFAQLSFCQVVLFLVALF